MNAKPIAAKLSSLVVALVVSLSWWGCTAAPAPTAGPATKAEEQPPAQPVKIRMGWGIPAEEIKYVMQARPELAPNLSTWYSIEWNQFAGTALGVQGLAAGTLDAATVGSLSVANGLDQGADIVITGEFIEERAPNFSSTWLVKTDSGINSVADMRGKNMGSSAIGGSTDYIAKYKLRNDAGLEDARDYKTVEVTFSLMTEALASGKIDAGNFPQPFYGAAMATGQFKPLFKLTDVQPEFVQLLQGFSRDFVKQNPTTVRKFVEDWTTVAKYTEDPANREAVIEASSKATKLPAEVLQRYLLSENDFFRPRNGALNVEGLQKNWDFLRKEGGIKKELKVTDHIIPELLPPAE